MSTKTQPEFDYTEQVLADWSDEAAMRLAFIEFSRNFLYDMDGECRYPDFEPLSIEDYKSATPERRQEALDYCLEAASSDRFTAERDEELRSFCHFLKTIKSEGLRNCLRLYHVGGLFDEPVFIQEGRLEECLENIDLPSDEEAEQLIETTLTCVRNERSKHAGYLGLAHQLIKFNEDVVPEDEEA